MISEHLNVHLAEPSVADDPAFYFDFASPEAYLSAERILALMPAPAEWVPIRGAQLEAGAQRALDGTARADFETLGAQRGVQHFVWPEPFPFESELALRAATYSKGIGRIVAFSLAAFRQCYAAGRSLEQIDNVLIAASGCEMHPAAVVKGCELRSTAAALQRSTELAGARGVRSTPALYLPPSGDIPARVFHGDAELEAATAALAARVG